MKNSNIKFAQFFSKKLNVNLFIVAMLFSLVGISKKARFIPFSLDPATTVKVNIDKNNLLEVKHIDLAEIQRFHPSSLNSDIWIDIDHCQTKNMGHIKSYRR